MSAFAPITIPKNNSEEIRVAVETWQGHRLVDVRIYAEIAGAHGERRPTKKGISLKTGKLPELISALQAAQAAADTEGGAR